MSDLWEDARGLDSTTNDAAADADGDGMDNIGEYLAETHPLDSGSVFKMDDVVSLGPSGYEVRWRSVEGRFYALSRSTNLPHGFSTIATQLPASVPVNVYTDQPPASPHVYYRVRTE
jgi:hypothetical protein